jgi:hypothetical protein
VPSSAESLEGSNNSIGYLGLVTGAFDTLGITAASDDAIPEPRRLHFTHSQFAKAMVCSTTSSPWNSDCISIPICWVLATLNEAKNLVA